jgi:hypothetical protein
MTERASNPRVTEEIKAPKIFNAVADQLSGTIRKGRESRKKRG